MTSYWTTIGRGSLLMYQTRGFDESRTKVASFDLDGTLIKTKSGGVFAKNCDDWMLWDSRIIQKLKSLWEEDYKIVIFTNQAGLGTVSGKSKIDGFKTKIEKIIESINVPIQAFVSTGYGLYRKPSPGMWFFMKSRNEIQIDLEHSFYVGDAAGRPDNWKHGIKADFSVADRMFAINIGIPFFTPEEYFLNESKVPHSKINFCPRDYEKNIKMPEMNLTPTDQEVIVMVGSPGSGKSHFVTNFIVPHGYRVISRDQLGSWQKCVDLLKNVIESKKSAVIDNTNPDRNSRQRYIELCSKYNIKVRCFLMNVTLERCLHNNKFREIVHPEHQVISPSLIKKFHSSFERPEVNEGFSSVLLIPFISHFENEQEEFYYNCYLVDK